MDESDKHEKCKKIKNDQHMCNTDKKCKCKCSHYKHQKKTVKCENIPCAIKISCCM